jgi:hypothetical protein
MSVYGQMYCTWSTSQKEAHPRSCNLNSSSRWYTKASSRWWTKRFLKRHPIYRKSNSKSLSAERQAAQEQADIDEHFRDFEANVKELDIQPDDIHNFDETGFRISCLNWQVVWTYTDVQAVYISDPNNRELVTLMECISGTGKVYKPMIVMSGIVFMEQHFDNDLDDDVLFGMSESGYTNDRLSFEWIKHFDKQTRDSKKGKYRMLIMDGHGSHLTHDFVNYWWDHDIVPFILPAHTTHLLQPLDIGFFNLISIGIKRALKSLLDMMELHIQSWISLRV